jgi:hypothetical protein
MKGLHWLGAAALLGFLGCLQPALRPEEPPADPVGEGGGGEPEQAESFDPLRLPEDELLLVPRSEREALSLAPGDEPATGEDLQPAAEGDYQVQLAATPDRELAEDLRLQALMLFPGEPVEVVWDPPNYKVRVGEKVSRDHAEELKRQALRLGYREAWVVRRKAR